MQENQQPVGVIDIGSNTTKLLVRNAHKVLFTQTLGCRIHHDASGHLPSETIRNVLSTLRALLKAATPYSVAVWKFVATSAIREAKNNQTLCKEVFEQTGIPLTILSGKQEADLIALGILQDPNLLEKWNFCAADLGGGSLEAIRFSNGHVCFAESFPLGAVRLTKAFLKNPKGIITQKELNAITRHTRALLPKDFPLAGQPLILLSGGLSAAKTCLKLGSELPVALLEAFLKTLCNLTQEERIRQFDLPDFRADVLPTSLAIVLTLANKAAQKMLLYSDYNLKHGVAQTLQ